MRRWCDPVARLRFASGWFDNAHQLTGLVASTACPSSCSGWMERLIHAHRAGRGRRRHHKFRAAVDAASTGPDDLRVARAQFPAAFRAGKACGRCGKIILRADISTQHVMNDRRKYQARSPAHWTSRLIFLDLHGVRVSRGDGQRSPRKSTSAAAVRAAVLL